MFRKFLLASGLLILSILTISAEDITIKEIENQQFGRYQLYTYRPNSNTTGSGILYLIDTATGAVWKCDFDWNSGGCWKALPLPPTQN